MKCSFLSVFQTLPTFLESIAVPAHFFLYGFVLQLRDKLYMSLSINTVYMELSVADALSFISCFRYTLMYMPHVERWSRIMHSIYFILMFQCLNLFLQHFLCCIIHCNRSGKSLQSLIELQILFTRKTNSE